MLLLVVVMVTVSVVMGDAPTAPCCVPPKWQSNIIDLKAKDGISTVTVFAHDEINMIEGYYIVPIGGQKPYSQGFIDYKNKMVYMVDMTSGNPTTYTCVQSVYDRAFYGGCNSNKTTPVTNLKYIGDSTMGPVGKALLFDVWSFTFHDTDITVSLTKDGSCIPLLENVSSNKEYKGEAFDRMIMFEKVSMTVSNPELLTIPAACIGDSPIG